MRCAHALVRPARDHRLLVAVSKCRVGDVLQHLLGSRCAQTCCLELMSPHARQKVSNLGIAPSKGTVRHGTEIRRRRYDNGGHLLTVLSPRREAANFGNVRRLTRKGQRPHRRQWQQHSLVARQITISAGGRWGDGTQRTLLAEDGGGDVGLAHRGLRLCDKAAAFGGAMFEGQQQLELLLARARLAVMTEGNDTAALHYREAMMIDHEPAAVSGLVQPLVAAGSMRDALYVAKDHQRKLH